MESPFPTASGAVSSPCRKYRNVLWRQRECGVGTVAFIGLNPSTADESLDDPTIRRCLGFAWDWGYSKLVVVNLFAWRSTIPQALKDVADPVGVANDEFTIEQSNSADLIVAAWGNMGVVANRGSAVVHLLRDARLSVKCLGKTAKGQPRHPLYVQRDSQPVPYL